MPDFSVLDTGVLLGATIEKDTHHEECIDYLLEIDLCYVTPTVEREFNTKDEDIRSTLSDEISQHRQDVSTEVDNQTLSPSAIDWIRTNLLNRGLSSYRFLEQYYQNLRREARFSTIDRLQVISDLEEMEFEVWEDQTEEHGGLESLVEYWEKPIPSYPDVEHELLIHEGDDPIVCIEAHHIATEEQYSTELATTNPRHFIRQVDDEPETREENILRVTNLDAVVDRSWDGSV
jgi:predicted nucleic acid-binding protein